MPPIPDFLESLEKMKAIHIAKNDDYASKDNPFSNFDVAAYLISQFRNPRDQVFACVFGIKIGRLATLLNSGKSPNNESVDDSFIDLANYALIWKADRLNR